MLNALSVTLELHNSKSLTNHFQLNREKNKHYSIFALSQTEKQLSVLAAVRIRATNCILIALNMKIPHGI